MSGGFRVDRLDHVEILVPDRYQAAEWYQRVLRLVIVPEFESWALDPRGPLMMSSDGGDTKLALFEGNAQGAAEPVGLRLVAFRVGAVDFLRFIDELLQLQLTDARGRQVTAESVVDHAMAYSIYFCDPFGHRLELTTYEYDETRVALESR